VEETHKLGYTKITITENIERKLVRIGNSPTKKHQKGASENIEVSKQKELTP
jgi:hypothetical protein